MTSNSMLVSTPGTSQECRERQRKNPTNFYDPNSDLSESEGLGGLESESGNTWEDNEKTDVDHHDSKHGLFDLAF